MKREKSGKITKNTKSEQELMKIIKMENAF
jgi:hypothetical protein